MLGTVFMALLALSLAVAGLALLVWWLWHLWGQREEQTTVQAIEIKAEPPTVEMEPPPSVEAQVEAPTSEAEAIEVEEAAPVEAAPVEATPAKADPVEEVAVAAPVVALETRAVEVEAEVEAPATEIKAAAEEPASPAKPDDLKRIGGIGPKIANVLQAGGISTYAQLADSDPDQLRQILEESDPRLLRIANPDPWPEQASLAAAGDWDGLEQLKAG